MKQLKVILSVLLYITIILSYELFYWWIDVKIHTDTDAKFLIGGCIMLKKIQGFYLRFTDWLGDKLAHFLSTMECFFLIFLLVIIPLFFQHPTGIAWVQYGVAVFFQGVALPVLGYVAWKSGERVEKVIKETHDVVLEELKIIKEELKLAREERDSINRILEDLKK